MIGKSVLTRLFKMMALTFIASSALAEHSCRFEWECLSTETCEDSGFSVTLSLDPIDNSEGTVAVSMESDAETIEFSGTYKDGTLSAREYGAFPTSRMLSATLPGPAIYTVHFGADLSITYIGSCE